MFKYIHHIMFDPLSWWEKTEIDLIGTAVFFGIIGSLFVVCCIYEKAKKSMRNQSGR